MPGRVVITDAVEIVDIALETVGGSAFFKRMPLIELSECG